MNILITYGGTLEPIDNVRHITNFSSGNTGRKIAEFCAAQGAQVTVLRSDAAAKTQDNPLIRTRLFTGFDSLSALVQDELTTSAYDAVIHAAAVSDYKVARIEASGTEIEVGVGKIPSGQPVTLTLEPTPKIVSRIQEWAPSATLIAFKLTNTPDLFARQAAAQKVLNASAAKAVILNDLSEVQGEKHGFMTLPQKTTGATLDDLCHTIWRLIA